MESRAQRESAVRRPEARVLALVVSANPDLQQSLLHALRAHGHSIVCAADVPKARAVLRQASPDVLIADLGPDLPALLPHLASTTSVIELSDGHAAGAAARPARVTVCRSFDPGDVAAAVERIRTAGPGPDRR